MLAGWLGTKGRPLAAVCLLVLSILCAVQRSHALTDPLPGAVPLPSGVNLLLPFPAGSEVLVLSGYGPSMGSSLHADTDATGKANDHYALDLNYANEPNGGKGMPIVAPLPGTVVRAGWATAGWANYGQRIILAHDLGDGHVYHSVYAHLNAIAPEIVEGASVAQGQVLGELGQSCQGELACSSFSTPHLHWVLHRDSAIGGSGTGGSYAGNAVVPEPLDGYEDLVQGMVLTSSNSGMVVCGDGFCNGGETAATCAADCACAPIPPEGRTVDDDERLCFTKTGSPDYWHTTDQGFDGGAVWTHATDAARADNAASWLLDFDDAGDYRIEAYVEPGFAGSTQAAYAVGASSSATVVADQAASSGWIDLGVHAFAAGPTTVSLADNTGEPVSQMAVLVFDALRVTRVGGPGAASTGSGGETGSGAGSGAGGADDGDGGEGCACAAGRGASGRWAHALLGAMIALAARARRRGRRLPVLLR
jgi:murein DD-endopeptidase MepM/ murein hydrolase activator NlpD